ncbi:hypothetical protein F4808DRAFT_263573 [Astrocystis sublimbata]|nr:hypothetical protein F4808DRAFT_263573 [Astrocystis sublimbata]
MAPDRNDQVYRLLDSDEESTTKEPLHRTYDAGNCFSKCKHLPWMAVVGVILAMVSSVAFGFTMGFIVAGNKSNLELSPYMRLAYNQEDTLWWNTPYSNESATDAELNRIWDTEIPWEDGIIALDNNEARAMQLPESQPFPWDAGKKSLYIVNAHHVLHCVRNLYISIQQYRSNLPQTINHPHILHCLDTLRVEVMCTADDTLRYVPLNSAHNGYRPGDGQPRKCRNWDTVQSFVKKHDPCYRYLKPGDTELSNLERFKFCPEESGYLPKIRKYFGYDDDWVPAPQEGPRELIW